MRWVWKADLICWSTSAAAAPNWCWSEDGRPLWMHSVKLGAARLTEQFLTDDPPTVAQRRRLEKHLEAEIGELMQAREAPRVVRVIGTSGTINTMVAMARASRGEELGRLHGAIASAAEVAPHQPATARGQCGDAIGSSGDRCEAGRSDGSRRDARRFRPAAQRRA